MTEKQNSGEKARDKIKEIQDRKLGAARAELAKLDNGDLAELLVGEFDRRRLDAEGNQNDKPGQYEAACTSMLALLGLDVSPMAERLAAVGRGVSLGPEKPSVLVREIAELVEALERTENIPESQKPAVLTKTLSERFDCNVDVGEITFALTRKTKDPNRGRLARIVKVAQAAGVETDEEHARKALEAFK